MKQIILSISLLVVTNCATIPTEFLTAIEKEKEGIDLLHKRHQQSVSDLVDNWYDERLNKLKHIKELEINSMSRALPDLRGEKILQVIKKEDYIRIESQFDKAIKITDNIRKVLIDRYSDTKNWNKLKKLSATNFTMSSSLLELNQAQKKFYRSVLKTSDILPEKKVLSLNPTPEKNNTVNKS